MRGEHSDLVRVRHSIARAVRDFCASRIGRVFCASELRAYVARRCGVTAPSSADRILRDLRQRAVVVYELISRSASLYRVVAVAQ